MKTRNCRLGATLGLLLLSACDQPPRELQPEDIWARVGPSVVRVEAKQLEGGTVIGSGFVCEMAGKKVVLSNRHVVQGAKEVRVGISAEELRRAPAYRVSPDLDLALIEIPSGMSIPPLKTRAGGVRIGERIFAVGFPLGLNKSITQGLVSSDTDELVQFDAPISSGNSGGPLVDRDGIAVGVVTAGSTGHGAEVVQNLNFAIKTAFVPKAELFQEPIVRFYDAWRELVGVENNLIDELHDRRVFAVQKCLEVELGFALLPGMNSEFAGAYQTNSADIQQRLDDIRSSLCAEEREQIIQTYGSLDAGATNVAAFLQAKVADFDRIPEIFSGLGSDELLRSFSQDQRQKSILAWDIKPSQIVPLLKISIEFAKARYEDSAFKIEFMSELLAKLRCGDTNMLTVLTNASEKWIGERTTVRLPYDRLRQDPTSEWRVRLFYLCDQTYGHRSTGPWLHSNFPLEPQPLTQQIAEFGGFESWITSMLFGKLAAERLERGDVAGAITAELNEVEMRRYPDLGWLAFAYACRGDFEKAYDTTAKAYFASFEQIDPFELKHGSSLTARLYLLSGLTNDGRGSPYPDAIKANLRAWTAFVARKPAFALAEPIAIFHRVAGGVTSSEMSSEAKWAAVAEREELAAALQDRLSSPGFASLNAFEKCWVFQAQAQAAAHADLWQTFHDFVTTNPATSNLYRRLLDP